ncbi:hypothetical protein TNCV_211171 [Trichonephila clavipes]|uniref:Tc1-like transposase DDE domain-containing protein n=1 Tax=Trichonephila clavipes TaxID=2585209 RepID=A0A8X6SYS0_TRICX|nr:hypothetical protein TNCV_211171 [Trichonephila clavipes]
MGAEFLFMDDNARSHSANIVDECLQSEDITRMVPKMAPFDIVARGPADSSERFSSILQKHIGANNTELI